MPETIEKLKDKILNFWNPLDKNQKSRLLISSLIFFVAVTAVVVYSTRKNYVTVFTVSNPRDVVAIEEALKVRKIHFKHGSNSTILVDKKDKNMAEFAIATVPNLSSTVSIEDTWSKIKMSSTESDKNHLWKDFKTNSLIAKLKMFDNVEDADVELSIPQETMIFSAQSQQKPSAFVRIKPKGSITPQQVQGIAGVVAASVGGMDPKDVTVVDNHFNPLNGMDKDPVMGVASSQYEIRQRIKQDMENSVRSLYAGKPDNFDYINVVANPVLDFNKQAHLENEVRKPTDLDEAIVSQSVLEERITNPVQGGVPGIDGNPPQYNIEGGASGGDYDKTTSTINRQYTTRQTEWEKSVGDIDYAKSSLTVALWYGNRVVDDSKMDDAFLAQLRTDVASATGIPAQRISVNRYRMAVEDAPEIASSVRIKALLDDYGLFALVVFLLVAFMLGMPKRKMLKNEMQGNLAMAGGMDKMLKDDELEALDFDGKSETLRQIEDFINEKPDSVVQLLRNWLNDDND
jgi:flagellar M-ring protein FliF